MTAEQEIEQARRSDAAEADNRRAEADMAGAGIHLVLCDGLIYDAALDWSLRCAGRVGMATYRLERVWGIKGGRSRGETRW